MNKQHDISTLPQWAQEEIERIDRRVAMMVNHSERMWRIARTWAPFKISCWSGCKIKPEDSPKSEAVAILRGWRNVVFDPTDTILWAGDCPRCVEASRTDEPPVKGKP